MRGRPKTHADNAEKQRAYRQRQKALRNSTLDSCVTEFWLVLGELDKHRDSLTSFYRANDRETFLRRKVELSKQLLRMYDAQPETIQRAYHERFPCAPEEYPRHFLMCSQSLGEWLLGKEYNFHTKRVSLPPSRTELSADD